ncbi:Ypq2p SCDLUD_003189 [Saccharomycodes ludwigii]|uniref:Ypq2p n=1 Tax=Saccharomycodes ludwigii TaxID=36035 RepID=UPI001E858A94|nr:hypothetical protein SCDLUD_003189 [Saccharomycodes ludwigii]KAH3900218.1 hypothetical protein SCDLUD_003189 [Saccharomycodes ludwigii]
MMSNSTTTPDKCLHPIFSSFSNFSGSVSFLCSLISQIPQLIETYNDKTVEGISPILLLGWLMGDITSLTGAIITGQLAFQIMLAIYFLINDLFICSQYYYYGILYDNKLATVGHEHKDISAINSHNTLGSGHSTSNNIITTSASAKKKGKGKLFLGIFSSFFTKSNGMPILIGASNITKNNSNNTVKTIGLICSWLGGLFYLSARIPQLIKNYRRKSTDGLSPFLFMSTIVHNLTYTLSIFTSCEFIQSVSKCAFVMNELPFILGSAGTLLFDFIYIYQHFVLYAEDNRIRHEEEEEEEERLLRQEYDSSENTPLLN